MPATACESSPPWIRFRLAGFFMRCSRFLHIRSIDLAIRNRTGRSDQKRNPPRPVHLFRLHVRRRGCSNWVLLVGVFLVHWRLSVKLLRRTLVGRYTSVATLASTGLYPNCCPGNAEVATVSPTGCSSPSPRRHFYAPCDTTGFRTADVGSKSTQALRSGAAGA